MTVSLTSTFRQAGAGFVLLSMLCAGGTSEAAGTYPTLRVDGALELVSDANTVGCKDRDGKPIRNDHSDMPARAFRDHAGQVHLLAGSRQNFQWTGPALGQVARRDCEHAVISKGDPSPDSFDAFQWLMSVYTEDGKKIFGLTHHEYHGDLHVPECKSDGRNDGRDRGAKRCWYTSVNLVVSTDGGRTFGPLGGRPHPVAMLPYKFSSDMNRAGPHAPTNIVRNPEDKNYYVMVHVSPYRDQAGGMCVMRASNLEKADWRAWGGKAFNVEFMNPYLSTIEDPRRHICVPVVSWFARSLTYNTSTKAFLLVGNFSDRAVYAWSKDLVQWSEPQTLMTTQVFSLAVRNRAPEAAAYFSVLDPSSAALSYDQTGQKLYLYYTRFTDGAERGQRGWAFRTRQLVRQPIILQ